MLDEEAALGSAWQALARSEGHRPRAFSPPRGRTLKVMCEVQNRRNRALDVIEDRGSATAREISKATGAPLNVTQNDLWHLSCTGAIEESHRERRGRIIWRAVSKGADQ